MLGNILLIGALVLAGGGAATLSPHPLYERQACNRDNLFRCFIDERYSVQASGFCSGLSPFTATVATTTATTTTTVQAQVTLDTIYDIITSTTTVFTTTIPTSTTTLTLGVGTVAKRDVNTSPPKCMTNGVTYPASRITSACSCIDVPASTVSITQTVSTATVTHTVTSFTTPLATITTWTTVSTATTGVLTVTVGPPSGTNRIINGDFETGNTDGWQLAPDSWVGTMSSWNAVPIGGSWSYLVTGSGDSIGSLTQVEPIYLEAGQYKFEVFSSLLPFPIETAGWGNGAVLEIVNPAEGTNITVSLAGIGVKVIYGRMIVIRFDTSFTVSNDAAGYNQVSFRYLTSSPASASIDGISLQKAA